MNSSDICHQISDCPGLFVDAFKGRFLREHTKNPNATFVLSHYHGDHYTQLPRDYKYKGPAKIHCTPITARLLVDVHLVSKDLVVEHEYGSTFSHSILAHSEKQTGMDDSYANITFYDANHCPGACIILIELPESKTVHLHTGDMRYHPRFQNYPLLAQSTLQKRLDLVYLDTTYCHPKHDFLAQEDAVDTIATQTQDLLSQEQKTLVLLSCYSIGKEKVLLEASKRSNQKIYVSEKKWKMLRCIQPHQNSEPTRDEKHEATEAEELANILSKCTLDPSESDLHVIPMGLAGEMWPYFQPNYQKLAKYVEDLSLHNRMVDTESPDEQQRSPPKEYDRVVAFIPTGWADATNWNKKNAISTKTVQLSSRSLHVEVRLISYSEHSTFSELVSFVQYLKPRKVIPTVYGDANHKRQIEGRFRNMLDSNRAKQAFFRSMSKPRSSPTSASEVKNELVPSSDEMKGTSAKDSKSSLQSETQAIRKEGGEETVDDIEVVCVVPSKGFSSFGNAAGSTEATLHHDKVDTLVSMGFDRHQAQAVLKQCQGNLERAINEILSESSPMLSTHQQEPQGTSSSISKNSNGNNKSQSLPATTSVSKKRKISDFFGQKKHS